MCMLVGWGLLVLAHACAPGGDPSVTSRHMMSRPPPPQAGTASRSSLLPQSSHKDARGLHKARMRLARGRARRHEKVQGSHEACTRTHPAFMLTHGGERGRP